MERYLGATVILMSLGSFTVHAAEMATSTATVITNTTTISASKVVSPGRYSASVLPSFNNDMGRRLEKALSAVPGIADVEAHAGDASIRFTVKDGANVRLSDLQKAAIKADTGVVLSSPVLAHSMAANPGL